MAEVLYHGASKRIEVATPAGRLVAAVASQGGPAATGESVRLVFARDALHLMDGP
ncbi:MAG: TOBE domain-containing protein [Bauldia sp.]